MKVFGFYESKKMRKIKDELIAAEKIAKIIVEDKIMFKNTIISLASILYINEHYTLATGLESGLNNLGFKILGVIQNIGYWICIVMCLKDIIQTSLYGGRAKDIGSVIIKYLLVFGSLHFVPKLFAEIPACMD